MKRKLLSLHCLLIATLSALNFSSASAQTNPKDRQVVKEYISQRYLYGTCDNTGCKSDKLGYKFQYWEYTPSDYISNTTKKFPLVIFLHGVGEKSNGSPNSINSVLVNGMPKLINQNKANYPFVCISPQTTWPVDWQPEMVDELIELAKSRLRIDEDMVYVTGLSMGGDGTYRYAGNNNYYKNLAAIVPCSAFMSSTDPCQIANIPVKAFTGKNDWVFASSQNAINSINSCTPKPDPLATLVSTVGGHDGTAWDAIYSIDNKELWDWLLSKKRKSGITNIVQNADISDGNEMEINPNPASEKAYLKLTANSSKEVNIFLINSLGAESMIYNKLSLNQGVNTIDLELNSKNKGFYILRVVGNDGTTMEKKLILE
ncbi:MAG: T9SS C-terminal target domain-containing protein [Cytophagales bacterium]|nr:MAG: T9SS C-terminal target domain-containing protein [Cytophagales bacterium]